MQDGVATVAGLYTGNVKICLLCNFPWTDEYNGTKHHKGMN